jgi:hypothetical protein
MSYGFWNGASIVFGAILILILVLTVIFWIYAMGVVFLGSGSYRGLMLLVALYLTIIYAVPLAAISGVGYFGSSYMRSQYPEEEKNIEVGDD